MQYRKVSILLSSITGLVISIASLNAYSSTEGVYPGAVSNDSHVATSGHQPQWVLASSSASSRSSSPSQGSSSGKSSGRSNKGSNDNRNGRF